MAIRKNHHFVPQFYFRQFSRDGKSICVLQRKTGKTIQHAPIKNQASKSWFYGDDSVETALGKIEAICSQALRKLLELRNPTEFEQSELVLLWVVLQRSRTMAARQASQPMQDKMLRLYLEVEINNDTKLDENTKQEMLAELDKIESNPVQSQLVEMDVSLGLAETLRDLTPVFLFNRTNRPFIFGDAPVVLYNGYYRDVRHRGVLGFDTPGLMVFLPLSPNVILTLLDGDCYQVKRVYNNGVQIRDIRDIASLNKLQIHSASECVYFNDFQFEKYVAQLWREEQKSLPVHAGPVIEAPGFDSDTGEPLGDIVHSFQPQIPYRLSLSFLQHDVIGDRHYRFARRSAR